MHKAVGLRLVQLCYRIEHDRIARIVREILLWIGRHITILSEPILLYRDEKRVILPNDRKIDKDLLSNIKIDYQIDTNI